MTQTGRQALYGGRRPLRSGLSRWFLHASFAGLGELRGEQGDAAAFDARPACRRDRGGGGVQTLFQQRALGARVKPLAQLGNPGMRGRAARITAELAQVEFERVVARGFRQTVRPWRVPGRRIEPRMPSRR